MKAQQTAKIPAASESIHVIALPHFIYIYISHLSLSDSQRISAKPSSAAVDVICNDHFAKLTEHSCKCLYMRWSRYVALRSRYASGMNTSITDWVTYEELRWAWTRNTFDDIKPRFHFKKVKRLSNICCQRLVLYSHRSSNCSWLYVCDNIEFECWI